MARHAFVDISAGSESWDAVINANYDVAGSAPYPVVVYATPSALPSASADNVNCIAATTTPKELWMSDGSAWRTFGVGDNNTSGARGKLHIATSELTSLSGATATWSNAFPAGAHALGVSLYVTTLVTSGDGGTSFNVGDGSDADRYAATVAFAAGTTKTPADATADPSGWRAAAANVVLTCVGGTFSAGAVRLVAYYLQLTAPTA